ncbi:MAG: SUMF1/EgtB/PvdO family nonheme iron enzyme, partial [Candidatus Latescibacterota bacterium]
PGQGGLNGPQISVQKPRGFTGWFRTGHPAVADRPQRDVVDDFLMDTKRGHGRRVPECRGGTGSLHRDSAAVVGVTWHQAQSYCESEGKRLPTEDERERACRGPAGARYGYGEYYDPRKSDARTEDRADEYPKKDTPPSNYGLFDMAGGVWERCVTGPDSSGAQRVLRGGACSTRQSARTVSTG